MTLVSFSLNLIKSNNHNKMKHMAEKLVNFLAIKISALIRLVPIINKTIALRRLWIWDYNTHHLKCFACASLTKNSDSAGKISSAQFLLQKSCVCLLSFFVFLVVCQISFWNEENCVIFPASNWAKGCVEIEQKRGGGVCVCESKGAHRGCVFFPCTVKEVQRV